MGKGRDRLAQSRFTVAARDEWLVPCNHRESDSASDGKVQFSLVQSPFFPNPEPNHQFSSGDLPEPRTEPLVQAPKGLVQVRGEAEPRTEPEPFL